MQICPEITASDHLKRWKRWSWKQHFATATMQVPKYAQPGQPAKELGDLELKVYRRCRTCRFPKCRKIYIPFKSYKCTAEDCKLSFYNIESKSWCCRSSGCANGFVIADIPGLIEGASEGVGLGHEFLRHIERTKVMIHVVDAAGTEGRDPVDDIIKINEELKAYNTDIAKPSTGDCSK